MSDLNYLIKKYTLKYSNKIGKLIEPLKRISGIEGIFRYTISSKGLFTFIGNAPEWNEKYYANHYYLHNSLLCHPNLISPGIYFSRLSKEDQDDVTKEREKNNIDHLQLIIDKNESGIEGYGFFTRPSNLGVYHFYQNEMPLIQSFIRYFKDELKSIISSMHFDQVNLAKNKGKAFYQGKVEPSRVDIEDKVEFYRSLGIEIPAKLSITNREKQVLSLIIKGRSSTEIAEILHISNRTVDCHINNLKSKLRCGKKSELFDRVFEMEKLGLLNLF